MKYFLSMLIFLSSITYSIAQDYAKLFEGKVFSIKDADLPYRIMYPKNFNPKQKYPLIVFLHGAGERGSDNLKQLTHGASMFASDSVRNKYPAIVIFPQCDISSYWANVKINQDDKGFRSFQFFPEGNPTPPMDLLVKFIKSMSKEKYVDKKRIYVGGLSMGGMGTFELLYRLPKVFAAAFPICGGSNPDVAHKYSKKVKLWIFHGEMDEVVSVEYSKQMHKAILANGGEAKLTLYPFVNHNSWENAFGEPELMPWLFSIKK